MTRFSPIGAAVLAVSLLVPAAAQEAPRGWKTQLKAGGARTFTPPDLRAGETYSVTTYDAPPLGGKSLESYLRGFAGTVGHKMGQLSAPLKISATDAGAVSGFGVYNGPNGAPLSVIFVGFSPDGANICVARTLLSGAEVLMRYQTHNEALVSAMARRARGEIESEANGETSGDAPSVVRQKLQPGGDIVPGVYVSNRLGDDELWNSFRVYLYPNGQYRVTDRFDGDYMEGNRVLSVGQFRYDRKTGQLELDRHFDLNNDTLHPETDFCFYGRSPAGKPAIYAERSNGSRTVRTSLIYAGPPTKRLSPSAERAREDAKEAEIPRFKFVTAPGRGVSNSQIAAILHHADYSDSDRATVTEASFCCCAMARFIAGCPSRPTNSTFPPRDSWHPTPRYRATPVSTLKTL